LTDSRGAPNYAMRSSMCAQVVELFQVKVTWRWRCDITLIMASQPLSEIQHVMSPLELPKRRDLSSALHIIF